MSRDDVPVMALEPLVILDLVLISWVDSGVGGREHRGVLWQQERRGSCPESGSVCGCLISHLRGAAGTGQLHSQILDPGHGWLMSPSRRWQLSGDMEITRVGRGVPGRINL